MAFSFIPLRGGATRRLAWQLHHSAPPAPSFLPFMSLPLGPTLRFLSGSDSGKKVSVAGQQALEVLGILPLARTLSATDDLGVEIRVSPRIVHGRMRRSHGKINCCTNYKSRFAFFTMWQSSTVHSPHGDTDHTSSVANVSFSTE